jgi:hypothetical protein
MRNQRMLVVAAASLLASFALPRASSYSSYEQRNAKQREKLERAVRLKTKAAEKRARKAAGRLTLSKDVSQ